jgi:hypothetical protein
MKERAGPVGRVAGLVEGLAAAARRRQQGREPRVVVYDSAGHARVLSEDDPAYPPLLDTGAALVGLRDRG